MAKKTAKNTDAVVPIRLPRELDNEVERVAKTANLGKADIMRLAIKGGLAAVEDMFKAHEKKAA